MNRDELLELGYGWLIDGIAGDGVDVDVEPWFRVKFADPADRLTGRPGPVARWMAAMQEKVQQLGALSSLAARGAARVSGATPLVTAADCELAFTFMAERGLLTSLCDPPRT